VPPTAAGVPAGTAGVFGVQVDGTGTPQPGAL